MVASCTELKPKGCTQAINAEVRTLTQFITNFSSIRSPVSHHCWEKIP